MMAAAAAGVALVLDEAKVSSFILLHGTMCWCDASQQLDGLLLFGVLCGHGMHSQTLLWCLPPQSRAVATDASGLYTRLPGDVEAPAAPAATAGEMQRTWTSLFLHACT